MTVPAFADLPCLVRVAPADGQVGGTSSPTGDAWRRAARETALLVGSVPAGERDCREILLELQTHGGANVSVATVDGRQAVRPVNRPDEVVPVVRALMVSVPMGIGVETGREVGAEAPRSVVPALRAASSEGRIVVIAGGGGRVEDLAGAYASPVATLAVAGLVGHMELGAFASRDFGYQKLSGVFPDGFGLSVTSFGLQTGLRVRIGGFAWVGGVTMGLSLVREQVTNLVEGMGGGMSTEQVVPVTYAPREARAGGYVGIVFPLRWRFRLRPQLGVDFVALRGGDTVPPDTPLPPLPSWVGMATLAVEGTAL